MIFGAEQKKAIFTGSLKVEVLLGLFRTCFGPRGFAFRTESFGNIRFLQVGNFLRYEPFDDPLV